MKLAECFWNFWKCLLLHFCLQKWYFQNQFIICVHFQTLHFIDDNFENLIKWLSSQENTPPLTTSESLNIVANFICLAVKNKKVFPLPFRLIIYHKTFRIFLTFYWIGHFWWITCLKLAQKSQTTKVKAIAGTIHCSAGHPRGLKTSNLYIHFIFKIFLVPNQCSCVFRNKFLCFGAKRWFNSCQIIFSRQQIQVRKPMKMNGNRWKQNNF